MTEEQRIQQYIDKGATRKEACAILGIPYKAQAANEKIDKDALRDMAIDTLAALIADMQSSPAAFKPNEIIAACREALDRTEGKAAQSVTVDTKSQVTHEYIVKLDPSDAYRRMIEGVKVIEHE